VKKSDLLLGAVVVATLVRFFAWQLPVYEAPGFRDAWRTVVREGLDYGPIRREGSFVVPAELLQFALACRDALPAGTGAVATQGRWDVDRLAKYYFYPVPAYHHFNFEQDPPAVVVAELERLRVGAVVVEAPDELPADSPLLDRRRFRPIAVGEERGGRARGLYVSDRWTRAGGPPPRPPVDRPGAGALAWMAGALALLALAGAAVVRLLDGRGRWDERGWGERLGLGFLAGAALLVPIGIGVGVGFPSLMGGVAEVGLIAWLVARRWRGGEERGAGTGAGEGAGGTGEGGRAGRGLAVGLALAIAIQGAFAVASAISRPIDAGDDLNDWGLKARVFHDRGAVGLPPEPERTAFVHLYYPPLVPLAIAYGYEAMGVHADGPAKLVFAGFFLASLGVLSGAVRRLGLDRLRAPAIVAVAATGGLELVRHSGFAWGDLPLAAFILAGSAAAWEALRAAPGDGARPRALLLAGLLLGAAAATKAEGAPIALLTLGLTTLFLVRDRLRAAAPLLRPALALAATSALVALPWPLLCLATGIGPDREHVGGFHLDRAPLAAWLMLRALAVPYYWAFSWVLVIGGVALAFARRLPRRAAFPLLLLGLHVSLVLAAYLATSHGGDSFVAQVNVTVQRLFLHFFPLALATSAAGLVQSAPTESGGTAR